MEEQAGQPLQELVLNDTFYQEVAARLEDPNEKDDGGQTLLHLSAWSLEDNFRIFKLLLDRGADVNSTTPYGYTPLHFAVCSKNRRAVVALLEAETSVNPKDFKGRTALHFAITKTYPSFPSPIRITGCDMWIVEKLLRHPEINLNPVDEMRETPLIWAVRERNLDAVFALLDEGANLNIPRCDNRTPLHMALLRRNPRQNIVFTLLINGAGIYCEDMFRRTPIDILIRNITNDRALRFAMRFVWLIAFQYQIRDSLKQKLEKIPELSNLLNDCCKEVTLMRKLIVHGKFTLYDFALDCFAERVENPVLTIYTPLVEILLTGLFSEYFDFIFDRISPPDLRRVLVRTIGRRATEWRAPSYVSKDKIFESIRRSYDENDVFKQRLVEFKEFLLKKI